MSGLDFLICDWQLTDLREDVVFSSSLIKQLMFLFGNDFTPDALPDTTFPIYPGLGQAIRAHWFMKPRVVGGGGEVCGFIAAIAEAAR